MMASCKTVFRIRLRGAGYSASSPGFSYLFTDRFEKMKQIANVMEVTFEQSFILPDGEQIKTSNE